MSTGPKQRSGAWLFGWSAFVAALGIDGCWLVRSNGDLDPPPAMDASSASDAAPDAEGGVEAGPLGCTVGDILCDDFEHGIASFWQNNDFPLSSTTTIDSTMAAHGKSSMHAHIEPPNGNPMGAPQAFIFADQGTTTPLPAKFNVRFFVYAKSAQLMDKRADVNALVVMFEPNMDAVELRVAGPAMAKTFAFGNYYDNVNTVSATPFPFDAWHCVEWGVTPDGVQVWLDDTAIADLTVTTTVKAVNGEMFGFLPEVQTLTAPDPQDIWYDEIVIASSRVGCQAFQEP